ncbi:MAG: hypothetical protein ACNA8N_06840 [Trueperaceae bacterium]
MQGLKRALRTVLAALVLTGLIATAGGFPTPTTIAGSSGQPGDIDVGTDPLAPTTWMAGSSGQPGDIDVGTDPLAPTTWMAGSSGQPGDIDVG